MALVADTNFTNTLVSVAAFSPFPTGGGNKVLRAAFFGSSGVLLDNSGPVSSISNYDLLVNALIDTNVTATGNGNFGFILNRDVSGKFYYIAMSPAGSGKSSYYIYRYSGGVGGTFTLLSINGLADPISATTYTPSTIFSFSARVHNADTGVNMALYINGESMISFLDTSASKITSGQPGFAANLSPISAGGDFTRYVDNWFVRQAD